MKIQFKDVIGTLLVIICFVLKFLKFDGVVDSALLLIVGYYFSKRYREETENGRKK